MLPVYQYIGGVGRSRHGFVRGVVGNGLISWLGFGRDGRICSWETCAWLAILGRSSWGGRLWVGGMEMVFRVVMLRV